ncbi:hypothetical protein pb186bvf_007363 [Paramecium bursaria]
MNKKHVSLNINPKVLDDKGEVNFGTSFLDALQESFYILIEYLDFASLVNFSQSTKVFKVRQWRKLFMNAIYERVHTPLQINLVGSAIDQKCQQFIFWDYIIDYKRIAIQFSQIYKYYSIQNSVESSNISKDIERSLQEYKYFRDYQNRQKLYRMLIALSKKLPNLGYIQGLNQIAGYFLLSGLSEQQGFWMMCYIMKKLKIQALYANSFEELKFLNFSINVFIENMLPDLYNLLSNSEVDISFITTRWFLTLFSYDIPVQLLLVVWNLFLMKGIKVLIKFSIAIFKTLMPIIDQIPDIYEFLKDILITFFEDQDVQKQVIQEYREIKITNTLIYDLRQKYELSEQSSFTLSFDVFRKKYYWKEGSSSGSRILSSLNDIISEIGEEKDSAYVNSQSFLNALFPKIINRQYLVACEGKKALIIKTEKRPQLILRPKVSPKTQFKMSVPKSANGDQESNISPDEILSMHCPIQEDSIDHPYYDIYPLRKRFIPEQ